jgi:hypothetical protein
MAIYSCAHYNYNEHYSTSSFSDLADGILLHWRLTSRAEHFWLRRLTDDDSPRGPTHQLPRNPAYHCWLRIHRDLLSRLLGMAQPYPGYDCKQVYNCCQPYPGYDRCLRSNTSQYIYIYTFAWRCRLHVSDFCQSPRELHTSRIVFAVASDKRTSMTILFTYVKNKHCSSTQSSYMLWRIMSSGMLRLVSLVRTDVSEELSTTFIRVTRIGELWTTLPVTSNRRTLRRNTNAPFR